MSSIISKLINLAGNITGTLAVANGGTGVTTSTGTTNNVLSNGPTISQPVINGVTDGSSAASGVVGEVLIQSRVRSSATSISSNTPTNVTATKLTLTAGDWDIYANAGFIPAATTSITQILVAISKTSASLPAADTNAVPTSGEIKIAVSQGAEVPTANFDSMLNAQSYISINASTDFYLVAQSTFSVSTMTVYGSIWARRRR